MDCARTPSPIPLASEAASVYARVSCVTSLLEQLFRLPIDPLLLSQLESQDATLLVTQAATDNTLQLVLCRISIVAQCTSDIDLKRRWQALHEKLSTTTPVFFSRPAAPVSSLVCIQR